MNESCFILDYSCLDSQIQIFWEALLILSSRTSWKRESGGVIIQLCPSFNLLPPTKRAVSAQLLSYQIQYETLIIPWDAPRLELKSPISTARPKDISFCLLLRICCFVCIAHKVGQSDIYCSFSQEHLSHNSKTYWEWIPPHRWYKTFKEFSYMRSVFQVQILYSWWGNRIALKNEHETQILLLVDGNNFLDTYIVLQQRQWMISLILTLACYNKRSRPILCLCRYTKNYKCFFCCQGMHSLNCHCQHKLQWSMSLCIYSFGQMNPFWVSEWLG